MIDLQKLFTDVFDPQPGEIALVLIDTPHSSLPDTAGWAERRTMAIRWHAALTQLAIARGFEVLPIVSFPATGAHNAQLPAIGSQAGQPVALAGLADRASLALALTQFSASAPLIGWTQRAPRLRVASMPLVSPAMESSALTADYSALARVCAHLRQRLSAAQAARISFSNGDTLLLDLRFREAYADDGQLRPGTTLPRVVNLPSGEAYSAVYEGEHAGMPSRTHGVLPVVWRGEIVRLEIAHNQVIDVLSRSEAATDLRNFLALDGARRNVAELGLGCNPRARVSGNPIEDEKAGPHIALGRSEHIGGITGPGAFEDPRHVWHYDFVYARASPLHMAELTLIGSDNQHDLLVYQGEYLVSTIAHAS
ncbi:MAG: hypothetical protein U0Z44_19690 [Kouleothrix sp.]